MKPRLHIFVCTNRRGGKMPSCGEQGSRLFSCLKEKALEKDPRSFWVTETKCLGWCSKNPGGTLISYPGEGKLYREVSEEDLPETFPELYTNRDSEEE